MIIDKYIDKLISSGNKFQISKSYTGGGSLHITADITEVINHNNKLLEIPDSTGLMQLAVDCRSQSLDPIKMRYELNRKEVLSKCIDQMLSRLQQHNKKHSGLSNPRMGGIYKFIRDIPVNRIVQNLQNKENKSFIDSLTLIYMMIRIESDQSEVMDMITTLKNQYQKVVTSREL